MVAHAVISAPGRPRQEGLRPAGLHGEVFSKDPERREYIAGALATKGVTTRTWSADLLDPVTFTTHTKTLNAFNTNLRSIYKPLRSSFRKR